jgi:acyl transferase domain-containing protein/NADP-dependent 3-hydroxy acid dehydrogenase YdfG/acyl-CoA thioesterase FadM
MKNIDDEAIAIVGMASQYPGAKNPLELWENILSQRVQFRRLPDERFPTDEYYDSNVNAKDRTYGSRVAVIDGYEFDCVGKRIPKQTYEATDTVQWLALDMTLQMLEDAGIDPATLPKETSGVILGNTLVGDTSRSNYFRLRWPFVRKSLRITAERAGMSSTNITKLENSMEGIFKSVFPDVNEDTIAGGLANTIAGRVCNYLDLKGGGYIVDGACASSLIAIYTAAERLLAGDLDFAIAGGVDMSLDTFELIGFAKAGALSRSEMRVYDKRGDGFIAGEGCGIIGLKRLSDAKRDGNKVYATLQGWGVATDGKSGIATPTVEGQSLALQRALKKSKFDTSSIDFIEGHGTGTKVGDYIELTAMADALNKDNQLDDSSCGVTSFKTIVGHTKAASGVGGLIKTVIALNQRVMPPLANCSMPHGLFSTKAKTLFPIVEGEVKEKTYRMRAGVSSMGFGGINTHILLESADAPYKHLTPTISEEALFVSAQDSELFVFSATTQSELKEQIINIVEDVNKASYAEMADLAKHLTNGINADDVVKASVVITSPFQAVEKLKELINILTENTFLNTSYNNLEKNIFISHNITKQNIAFVFPGQGSQQINGAKKLIKRYPWAKEILNKAAKIFEKYDRGDIIKTVYQPLEKVSTDTELKQIHSLLQKTQTAQPTIVLASIIWYEYLLRIGVTPAIVAGHSLGELTAFYSAGTFSLEDVLELAVLRGKIMASSDKAAGSMASLMCNEEKAEELIKKVTEGYIVLANLNSPRQTVVAGDKKAIERILEIASTEEIRAVELNVSNAFHSNIVDEAAKAFKKQFPISSKIKALNKTVISSIDGKAIKESLNLKEHFSEQITNPVDFVNTANTIDKYSDTIIEVGTGGVLSNLLKANIGDNKSFPVATEADSFKDINTVISKLYISGCPINWENIYENRLIRPFIAAKELKFIVNPCEYEFSEESIAAVEQFDMQNDSLKDVFTDIPQNQLEQYLKHRKTFISDVIKSDIKTLNSSIVMEPLPKTEEKAITETVSTSTSTLNTLLDLATKMTGFPRESLNGSMHLLDDLNFDSIKAGELITTAVRNLKITKEVDPIMLAGASIDGIAKHLDTLLPKTEEKAITEIVSTSTSTLNTLLDLATKMTGFPRESLNGSMHLLDDLNFDSIKAGELITTAVRNLKITKEVDPIMLAGASIDGIAKHLDTLLPKTEEPSLLVTKNINPEPIAYDKMWVREFILENIPSSIDKTNFILNTQSLQNVFDTIVGIVYEDAELELAKEIQRTMQSYNVKSKLYEYNIYDNSSEHVIAILSRSDNTNPLDINKIEETLNKLRIPLHPSLKSITYVQFDRIQFEDSQAIAKIESSCAASYAASAHFERPSLRVRVVDFDSRIDKSKIVNSVLYEQLLNDNYIFASYDKNDLRYTNKPVLLQTQLEPKRTYKLSKKDVVIVTGGAKGITAECAMALAIKTGATMALVGSSPYPKEEDSSNEIIQTLKKFTENNIPHNYYNCNIADYSSVDTLVKKIQEDFGRVTCIIHGAGINNPSRTGQLDAKKASNEVAPKVAGIMNLCNALGDKAPKLIVGLSSVIGMTGMPGNSLYGFSNEALDIVLKNYEQMNPGTDIISIAYSVWADVGMGAKSGSTKYLEKMGIFSIPVNEGVKRFLRLVEYKPQDRLVAVSAQLGGLDTWVQESPVKPKANRFLENVLAYQSNVEIVSHVHISLENDKYIKDHKYRNTYLFPTVFGLEAMAQNAACVLNKATLDKLTIEDMRLDLPIIVNPVSGIDIYIKASVIEREAIQDVQIVEVMISTEKDSFTHPAFSAKIVLSPEKMSEDKSFIEPTHDIGIEPLNELYGHQLFQGNMFRRINKIFMMNDLDMLCQVNHREVITAFSEKFSNELILGDACFRDAMLQSSQLTEEAACLPIGISKLVIFPKNGDTSFYVRSKVIVRSETKMECQVQALNEKGQIIEEMKGYKLKKIKNGIKFLKPEQFANPIINDKEIFKKALNQIEEDLEIVLPAIVFDYKQEIATATKDERHKLEYPIFSYVGKILTNEEVDVDAITWNDNGKPIIKDQSFNLSLSHNQAHILCTAGYEAQGSDIELVEERSKKVWDTLLGVHANILEKLIENGDTLDQAGTRIWSVMESFIKAFAVAPEEIIMKKSHSNSILFIANTKEKKLTIATFPLIFTRNREKIVAIGIEPSQSIKNKDKDIQKKLDISESCYIRIGENGQSQQCYQFRVSFKEATMLQKLVNYSTFAFWMGKVREAALLNIGTKLIDDTSSGNYAWVTNYSKINILGNVTSFDLIEGRTWTSKRFGSKNSSNVLHFDWIKINENGVEERVAYCEMATTWVLIKDHGIVESAVYPDYLEEFMLDIEPSSTSDSLVIAQMTESLKDVSLSNEIIYKAKEGPIVEPLLHTEIVQTTLEHSNFIGNIYFAHYYEWQKSTLDRYMYSIIPEYYRGVGEKGELFAINSEVFHLREAMPFSSVKITIHLKTLHNNGVEFYFNYYALDEDNTWFKLAYGILKAIWMIKKGKEFVQMKLPLKLINHLKEKSIL